MTTAAEELIPPGPKELAHWRALATAATRGPWTWNETRWNERYPKKKDWRRHFVYSLEGPPHAGLLREDLADPYDHPSVMRLYWGVSPRRHDMGGGLSKPSRP
jgi:hypothetical protein